MQLQVAGIVDDSIVDGDGCRLTVFVQGCARRCHGCQNQETQPMEGGHRMDTEDILARLAANPLLAGITFSGGEPFLQPAPLAELARAVHARGLDVWSYSGYTLEQLCGDGHPHCEVTEEMLSMIDVLVDGRFVEALKDVSLKFRGSSNQRIIDLKQTKVANEIVLYCE